MPPEEINSYAALKQFIYRTLCSDHHLLYSSFSTTETLIKRGKNVSCGMMFCLNGPRSVKFTAIWESDNNYVFFYGADGKRYRQTRISVGNKITADL
ncbi:MAG: hypothetical protein FWE67_02055 [Planctomycetaceae bacterium]|nr:hypothetical protein [Planctomycetaceae bacterium]